jgi:ribulose-5-phosphate 4-epimerase/fuculose-1-phosphate aldolase
MVDAQARDELARCCLRLWERRLVSGTSGNVSLRLEDGDLLVTPASRSLGDLSPDDMVRVASDGTPRERSGVPTSELPLHVAAYAARADANCVVHTHPTFCVVWSLRGRVFPRETVGARESLGTVAWTVYHPNGSHALAAVCAAAFSGGADLVLMERHGLSVVAGDLATAFVRTDQAEEAARVAYFSSLQALTSGKNTHSSESGGPL